MVHLLSACTWAAEHGWGTWDKRVTWTHLNLWPNILDRQAYYAYLVNLLSFSPILIFLSLLKTLPPPPTNTLTFIFHKENICSTEWEPPHLTATKCFHLPTSSPPVLPLALGSEGPHPETQILQGPASAVFLLTGWGVWPGERAHM